MTQAKRPIAVATSGLSAKSTEELRLPWPPLLPPAVSGEHSSSGSALVAVLAAAAAFRLRAKSTEERMLPWPPLLLRQSVASSVRGAD